MSDVPFTVTDKQEILKVQGKDLLTVTELLKVDENRCRFRRSNVTSA